MHDHGNKCKHELKFCSICDVVYCEKCDKEWKNYWFTPYYQTWSGETDQLTNPDHNISVSYHTHNHTKE